VKFVFKVLAMIFIISSCKGFSGDCQEVSEQNSIDLDQPTSYGYVSVGMGPDILAPCLGVGFRHRLRANGFDGSLRLSTIGFAHALQANCNYLRYINPERNSSWYVGVGPAISLVSINTYSRETLFFVSPNFVIGKEIVGDNGAKQFHDFSIQSPHWNPLEKNKGPLNFPAVYYRYGLAF